MSRKNSKRRNAPKAKQPTPQKSWFSLRRFLIVVLAAELVWGGWQIGERLLLTSPPSLRIDAEMLNIQDRSRDRLEALQPQLDSAVRSEQTPQAWYDLGSLYLTAGHYPQAEQCLRHAQELDPASGESAYGLGVSLDLLGRMSEAIEQYERIVPTAVGRQRNACYYQIGKNYLRQEKAEEATKAFRKIYTFLPASYELVKLYTRQGKLDQAIKELRILIFNRPDALETHASAARFAAAQGKEAVAARHRKIADTAEREAPFLP